MKDNGWMDDAGSEEWRVPDVGSEKEELEDSFYEAEFDRQLELRGYEAVFVDFLVEELGKPDAAETVGSFGTYVRGDPALAGLLELLRALRRQGVLTDAGYFYIVSTIMEEHELRAADGDPEVVGMMDWLRANQKTEDPDAESDWEFGSQSKEWQEVEGEHIWRCHLALMHWLRELGDYEMAFLAEFDPGMCERKRIAGEGDVCGRTWISSNRCPENDGVRGYRDPLC